MQNNFVNLASDPDLQKTDKSNKIYLMVLYMQTIQIHCFHITETLL